MFDKNHHRKLNRRDFLKKSSLGAGLIIVPSYVVGTTPKQPSPASRINIAIVGVAGRGQMAAIKSRSHNVVALCDVDEDRVVKARTGRGRINKQFNAVISDYEKKGARWYADYRLMFEEMTDKIDAVIISTPDHMHFPIVLSAINLGKNVYCESPLAHTVEEVRILARASRDTGVVTQMGNQGHSNRSTVFNKEIFQTGLLGQVRDVYFWTNRSGIWWKQSEPIPGHSRVAADIPGTLAWDLWLGIARSRPYDPGLLPINWRIYNDFGNGVIGDMGCHIMDLAYWGLDLPAPEEIEASTIMNNCYPFPVSSVVTYTFPCRGGKPPVNLHWYEGGIPPAIPDSLKIANIINEDYLYNGSLIVGDQGLILSDAYGSNIKIYQKDGHNGWHYIKSLNAGEKDNTCHYGEFFRAITESRIASSDFSYAGPLTEMVLLGHIAQRIRGRLTFEKMEGNFTDNNKANKMLKKEYPEGWIVT